MIIHWDEKTVRKLQFNLYPRCYTLRTLYILGIPVYSTRISVNCI